MRTLLIPESFSDAVGLAVAAWRQRRSETQGMVAARTGVPQPTICRIEAGGATLENLYRLLGDEFVDVLSDAQARWRAARKPEVPRV